MTLKDIKNNNSLIKRVSDSIIRGTVSHAYIFSGGTREDRILAADSFAKAALCSNSPGTGCDFCIICRKITNRNHEDIVYVDKDEKGSVKDEAIEELQKKLKKKPFTGDRNIAIINDADTMTKSAYNRLLKTLEEPFPGTIIILLSDNVENLTKTILSRCVLLRWNPFIDEGHSEAAEKANGIINSLFRNEPFYSNRREIMDFAENRDEGYALLNNMENLLGERAKGRYSEIDKIKATVSCIEEARQELMRGMQVSQSMKRMMLKIGG